MEFESANNRQEEAGGQLFALRAKVNQLVEHMLEQNVIEPTSSPWASLIVLV